MLSQLLKKPSSMMVGIDIGSHCIKAVLLQETDAGLRLEALAIEPMPKGAMSERSIQDIEAIGNVVAKLKRKLPKTVQSAAVAVSGQTVITKVIFMDVSLTDAELESQIAIEADSLIPYPLDEVNIDFEKLAINEADPSKVNVLLSAARTESVEARIGVLEAANLTAKVVDVESYALSRSLDVYYQQLPSDAYDKCVAIVDIGAVLMLVSVVQAGETIYTRDQVFGGDQYTNSIVAYYNKSFDEAEIGKTTGDLPPNYTFEVLAPFQTSLLQQVRRAVQMFLTTSGKDQVDYIVLTGGTAMIEGLDRLLIEELGIHTVVAEPFANIEIAPKVDRNILQRHRTQFAIATGLALRSFSSCHI
ncbi:pilus assembly protein PilM [Pseudoalteromonas sp. MEBiC 03607]|jgi:type IV pilus assembly protein PilM|uniref:pilus assembly protein PilM n=1 Tax=Pseudoalteromonas TaxID=53246 RepID=UPI000C3E1775|nr:MULTISPECIES: pilus assembly protein PilM [unclassified Pseudoalteromonas]MBD58069.1 pilus assembly protein PilM [Pseudoalteromonas sp.]MCF2899633.1 pilus assembly protein PilM [Pseudoalteromonas sp. OFAV1]MCF2920728.1 pilus assembly protein PilM [Pseudoalteromonas sp. APAL1]MCO7248789.1 pilus assembly protein PilM [Pseudoalteromonas sp. Ps84H-4]TGV18603.1 pilus assembly protein PilM [Pseudoalteromonas sp. MEBiC 03607]|tara:strand:- start:7977 stop:9056 length:1080 start_codon:yes stop_codon:yes gene_type:complete